MASLKIRLVETASGPQVTVDYESEPDALSHEHERDHRRAVARLLGLTEAEMEAQGVVLSRDAGPAREPAEAADGGGQARAAVSSREG